MTQRRVLGLAVPMIGESVLQTTVSAVDALIVVALGEAALAGAGTASEMIFFCSLSSARSPTEAQVSSRGRLASVITTA
jgi:Na+-driven multidrug efflux pump